LAGLRCWWLEESGMNSDAQDGLFDEALVERVQRPDDGIVETRAGVNKRFKAFNWTR
jgi:hypothetical protein